MHITLCTTLSVNPDSVFVYKNKKENLAYNVIGKNHGYTNL